jgi:hypothetical protein
MSITFLYYLFSESDMFDLLFYLLLVVCCFWLPRFRRAVSRQPPRLVGAGFGTAWGARKQPLHRFVPAMPPF